MDYDLTVAYCLQGKSLQTIADELGCTRPMVRKRLQTLGIEPNRERWRLKQVPPTKEQLEHLYLTMQQSCGQIGRMLGRNENTIKYWVMKYGIPLRSLGESNHVARGSRATVPPELLEFIEGELLGDGSVLAKSQWSARYAHTSKHLGYIEWLAGVLAGDGIEQSGGSNPSLRENALTYHYQSRYYAALRPLRDRWYPGGKKHIPANLVLTPLRARQWYIGDGSYYPTKDGLRAHIVIYTMGFAVPEVEALVAQLNELGFLTTRQPSANVISISAKSTADFLDWIGPCPDAIKDIYGYKWAA